jgi:hypothetical protein
VFEPDQTPEFGHATSRLVWLMRAGHPLKLFRQDDRERHGPHHTREVRRERESAETAHIANDRFCA